MEKEIEKMFKDEKEEDLFADILGKEVGKEDTKEAKDTVADEEGTDKGTNEAGKPNRHHRRLESQLKDEREARIALEAEMKAIRYKEDDTKVDERLSRMYGTEEGGKEAALLHQQILNDEIKKAKESIMTSIREEREQDKKEVKKQEDYIDVQLESLEEDLKVDLTSNSPAAKKARTGFLEALQALSPKDDNGNITQFADTDAAWEYYNLKKVPAKSPETSARQKELSSKGMDKAGNADSTDSKVDSQRDYLRSIGINI